MPDLKFDRNTMRDFFISSRVYIKGRQHSDNELDHNYC
jgi:hypothetical protein